MRGLRSVGLGLGLWLLVPGAPLESRSLPPSAGITHQEQPSGLPFPSFNNYIDNNSYVVPDERRFFKARVVEGGSVLPGLGSNELEDLEEEDLTVTVFTAYIRDPALEISYRDPLAIAPRQGMLLRFAVYLHNNGDPALPGTEARDTRVVIEGFALEAASGRFVTPEARTRHELEAEIRAQNARPAVVTSTTSVVSANPGQAFRLEVVAGSAYLMNSDSTHSVELRLEDMFGESGAALGAEAECERSHSGRFGAGEKHISWLYFDALVLPGPATGVPVDPRR